jgi:hypothetical protein
MACADNSTAAIMAGQPWRSRHHHDVQAQLLSHAPVGGQDALHAGIQPPF